MPSAIELTDATLVVHVEGADRVWAIKSHLTIPLEHVVEARSAADEARAWLHGIRLGGTHIPGVISAGTFYSQGRMVFWDVHDPDKAIGVELRDERYSRLVLEVENPAEEPMRINAAATAATPA